LYSEVVVVDHIELIRPGPRQGFQMLPALVFHVRGQEIEYDANLHATPGEKIRVRYMVGESGKVYVWDVSSTGQ
jgi:hypothetical protein